MKEKKYSLRLVVCLTLSILLIQACAVLNETREASNIKVYNRSYNEMINIIGQAIRNNKLEIWDFVEEQRKSATVTFGRRDAFNNRSLPTVKGYVHITRLESNKRTEVKIQNPKYSYATPSEYQKDYERILLEEIDKLVSR